MKVLIVDDASIMRAVLRTMLKKNCGIKENDIYEAGNGRDGILAYKKAKPDIVFLDISMPDLDGFEVVKRLIEIDSEAVIIMCTSSAYKKDVQACVRAGAKDYIIKPLQPDRVRKAIMKFALAAAPVTAQTPETTQTPEAAEAPAGAGGLPGEKF
jgi:two-component system chemotaxis response regulator CheY